MEIWVRIHEACGILTLRTHLAWNKNARVKLHIHESKLCIYSAWFLMHMSFHGERGVVWMMELLYVAPWLFIFVPTKGKWRTSTLGMFKEFWNCFSRFVVHVHASRKKMSLKMQRAWIPKYLPSFYFIIFFERDSSFFLTKRFSLYSLFTKFLAKLKQGWDKTAWAKHRGIW